MSKRPLHEYVAEVSERSDIRVGVPLPLGTYAHGEGVNFAFFSRNASCVQLELFDNPRDATAVKVIDLDPARNRTGDVWHVWIKGIKAGQLYAYRLDGPYQPVNGYRFSFSKFLIDPMATAISDLPAWDFGLVGDTILPFLVETQCVRWSIMPVLCRNAFSRRSIFTGMRTVLPGILGRRRSFMKRTCVVILSIPAQG
jgi:Carbohydrate-binding module 48 (Isoamylase N-terminal domain)